MAAPATVSGEPASNGHWETGKAGPQAVTREPGDLPAQSPNRWAGRSTGAAVRSGDMNRREGRVRQHLPRLLRYWPPLQHTRSASKGVRAVFLLLRVRCHGERSAGAPGEGVCRVGNFCARWEREALRWNADCDGRCGASGASALAQQPQPIPEISVTNSRLGERHCRDVDVDYHGGAKSSVRRCAC